jgi:hypothetical protein
MAGPLSFAKANVFKLSEKKAKIKLTRLKPENDAPNGSMTLQYWPEAYTDTKATNWQSKPITGGNLPLYSWVNGGERGISFSAKLTTDVDVTKWVRNPLVSERDDQTVQELKQKGLTARNFDIRTAQVWLRSLLMPTYKSDGTYLPPPKVALTIPGSHIGLMAGNATGFNDLDTIIAILKTCDFSTVASFPNGVPRIVDVTLAFDQIAQYQGIVQFPGNTSFIEEYIKDNPLK